LSTALQLYDDPEQRLASIETVDEAKAVGDQAEALRLYVKQRHRGLEAQNHCAFVKVLAECRAGTLLRTMERAQGDRQGNGLRSTMERSGIAPVTGHRWQIMALVPETTVRQLWTKADAQGKELTSVAIYRVGKALHQGRREVTANGDVRTSTEQEFERLVGSIERCLQLERYTVLPLVPLAQLRHLLTELRLLRDRVGAGVAVVTRQIDVELHDLLIHHDEAPPSSGQ
jgi:hypothetical protein